MYKKIAKIKSNIFITFITLLIIPNFFSCTQSLPNWARGYWLYHDIRRSQNPEIWEFEYKFGININKDGSVLHWYHDCFYGSDKITFDLIFTNFERDRIDGFLRSRITDFTFDIHLERVSNQEMLLYNFFESPITFHNSGFPLFIHTGIMQARPTVIRIK